LPEFFTLPQVIAAKASGHEIFHRLPEEFFALVAEKLFRLSVDESDAAGGVDDDHGIRSRFEQGGKLVFGPEDFARLGRLGLTTQTVGGHDGVREPAHQLR